MLSNLPHEHKPLLILSAIVLLMLALFLALKSWLTFEEARWVGKPVPYEYTVNIEGVGTAHTKPDLAKISFSVESKQAVLADAQNENTKRMNNLLGKLVAMGIEQKDMQTSSYNSYEDQRYNDKTGVYDVYGWIVSQTVDVTIRDLEKVSSILTWLGQNEATNISGPYFSVQDDSAAQQEAREKALTDAKQKADSIAKQLGIKLGPPTSYGEWKEDMPYYGSGKGGMMDAMGSTPVVPTIQPGLSTTKLHVNLSFTIER